jgi:hypothetical protein
MPKSTITYQYNNKNINISHIIWLCTLFNNAFDVLGLWKGSPYQAGGWWAK